MARSKKRASRWIALATDMPETLYSLGKAASLDGDKAAAEKAWLGVVALEKQGPIAAQAHFGLANLYRSHERKPSFILGYRIPSGFGREDLMGTIWPV